MASKGNILTHSRAEQAEWNRVLGLRAGAVGVGHAISRIDGKVKVRTTLWSPQLSDEEIAAELADLAPVPERSL